MAAVEEESRERGERARAEFEVAPAHDSHFERRGYTIELRFDAVERGGGAGTPQFGTACRGGLEHRAHLAFGPLAERRFRHAGAFERAGLHVGPFPQRGRERVVKTAGAVGVAETFQGGDGIAQRPFAERIHLNERPRVTRDPAGVGHANRALEQERQEVHLDRAQPPPLAFYDRIVHAGKDRFSIERRSAIRLREILAQQEVMGDVHRPERLRRERNPVAGALDGIG